MSRNYTKSLQSVYARGLAKNALIRLRTQIRANTSNPPTCTDSFTFLSSDPVRNPLFQRVAEYLQWCASIHVPSLAPTALRFSSSRSTLSNISKLIPTDLNTHTHTHTHTHAPHHSVLVQSGAQKCCRRMPQILSRRRLPQRS